MKPMILVKKETLDYLIKIHVLFKSTFIFTTMIILDAASITNTILRSLEKLCFVNPRL